VVINALRHESHISHFTLQEASDLLDELEIPIAYFTHISHQLGLHQQINDQLPSHRQLGFDGQKIEL
jgi:phosphoribosyl 1,2-cyclic phosphate phosphodiesterase